MFERLWYDDVYRLKVGSIVAGTIITLTIIAYIITYRGYTYATVQETNWELRINIMQYTTHFEDDWYIPNEARVYDTRREIHHWEEYEVGRYTERYVCGEDICSRTIVEYDDRPVYRTKYYYEIDRWTHVDTLTTSGNDKELVAWPDTTGYNHNAPNVIGQKKLGQFISHFWIIAKGDNDKIYSLDMTESFWRDHYKGKTIRLTLGFFGNVIGVQ